MCKIIKAIMVSILFILIISSVYEISQPRPIDKENKFNYSNQLNNRSIYTKFEKHDSRSQRRSLTTISHWKTKENSKEDTQDFIYIDEEENNDNIVKFSSNHQPKIVEHITIKEDESLMSGTGHDLTDFSSGSGVYLVEYSSGSRSIKEDTDNNAEEIGNNNQITTLENVSHNANKVIIESYGDHHDGSGSGNENEDIEENMKEKNKSPHIEDIIFIYSDVFTTESNENKSLNIGLEYNWPQDYEEHIFIDLLEANNEVVTNTKDHNQNDIHDGSGSSEDYDDLQSGSGQTQHFEDIDNSLEKSASYPIDVIGIYLNDTLDAYESSGGNKEGFGSGEPQFHPDLYQIYFANPLDYISPYEYQISSSRKDIKEDIGESFIDPNRIYFEDELEGIDEKEYQKINSVNTSGLSFDRHIFGETSEKDRNNVLEENIQSGSGSGDDSDYNAEHYGSGDEFHEATEWLKVQKKIADPAGQVMKNAKNINNIYIELGRYHFGTIENKLKVEVNNNYEGSGEESDNVDKEAISQSGSGAIVEIDNQYSWSGEENPGFVYMTTHFKTNLKLHDLNKINFESYQKITNKKVDIVQDGIFFIDTPNCHIKMAKRGENSRYISIKNGHKRNGSKNESLNFQLRRPIEYDKFRYRRKHFRKEMSPPSKSMGPDNLYKRKSTRISKHLSISQTLMDDEDFFKEYTKLRKLK